MNTNFHFNIPFIQKVVGTDFRVQERNGNFKVDIAAMGVKGNRITFHQKHQSLCQAVDKLKEAGYEITYDDINSGWLSREGWRDWPHIWVNIPVAKPADAVDVAAVATRARRDGMSDLINIMKASGALKATFDAEAALLALATIDSEETPTEAVVDNDNEEEGEAFAG